MQWVGYGGICGALSSTDWTADRCSLWAPFAADNFSQEIGHHDLLLRLPHRHYDAPNGLGPFLHGIRQVDANSNKKSHNKEPFLGLLAC